ncbi:MAG: hypothetical protein GTN93_26785 [Anaerolineae bacterium]|nr:hypothetical protein [Anaerolineae bacterium]
MNKGHSAILVSLLALLIAGLFVGRILSEFDWNPSALIKFGEVFTEQNEYAEDLLGDIVLSPQAGHDGKFFFSQAMDPFYLESDVHAVYLDRPSYRAQRMLYPTVASLGGLLPPTATAWGLIVVNVLAMGLGAGFTALVAMEMGLARWFGLAFVLNPGMLAGLAIDGAGVLTTAGLMAGVYYVLKGQLWSAAAALTVAALSRETMLLGAAGLGLYWIWKHRKIPWALGLPFVGVAAWWAYVHWRLGDGLSQDTQALDAPFVGLIEAAQRWGFAPEHFVDASAAFVLLLASILIFVRSIRNPTALGFGVSGFAVLGVLLSAPVWLKYFDSSRALAPVLTAYVLLVPAASKTERMGQRSTADSGDSGDAGSIE